MRMHSLSTWQLRKLCTGIATALLFLAPAGNTAPLRAQAQSLDAEREADLRCGIAALAVERSPCLPDLSGSLSRVLLADTSASGFRLIAPQSRTVWNSALPDTRNQGSLWAGRGVATQLRAGAALRHGRLSLIVVPEISYSENRPFQEYLHERMDDTGLLPWRIHHFSADVPLRVADEAFVRLEPGQSTFAMDARPAPLLIGVSTEDQWWGPGVRNALVLSNNAPGIPHVFARTSRPVGTRLGDFSGSWMVGWLADSPAFTDLAEEDARYLSAAMVSFTPWWEPGLTVGAARAVHGVAASGWAVLSHSHEALLRWKGFGDPGEINTVQLSPHYAAWVSPQEGVEREAEQILSFFARWAHPADHFEIYGEWARRHLPGSLHDFLTDLNHTQGYTLGMAWSAPLREGRLRIHPEVSYLEPSPTYRRRPVGMWYASAFVPQGYTHRGQVIGASIGPSGSSQWLAVDYLTPRWSAGLYTERVRWDTEVLGAGSFEFVRGWPHLAHDVSIAGGVRAGATGRLGTVEMDLSATERMNYLFQNWSASWEDAATHAVNVRNYSVRLTFSSRIP
jgi:hypothetical protein